MFDRLHRHGRLIGIGLAAALLNACGGGGASSPETEPFYIEEQEEWSLVWADEFNGSSVDSSNWTFQTGDGSDNGLPGWGNYELQYYQADNAVHPRGGRRVLSGH
jgi:beta-glucanase (GH16 family)